MLAKMRSYFRPLPVMLGIGAFSIGVLGTATLITGVDIESILTGKFPQQVTVAELRAVKLKPVLMIDVRSPEEYAEDRIGKSPLVPITDIEAGIGIEQVRQLVKKSVKQNQTQPTIVIYCAKGPRSVKAYKLLQETGLKMAVLSGGMTAWRKEIPAEKDTAVLSPFVVQPKD